jgi:hypothetical protein
MSKAATLCATKIPPEKPVALARFAAMFAMMDWQQLVALLIVATAAALLVWGRFRRRKFKFGRDTHCGCSSPASAGSQSSIVFHARKGEPPRVVLKMK